VMDHPPALSARHIACLNVASIAATPSQFLAIQGLPRLKSPSPTRHWKAV
jgi:hypothetical protein